MKDLNLKIILADILKGYSSYNHKIEIGGKVFYSIIIKHTDNHDSSKLNYTYDFFYKRAIDNKIPTDKERLNQIILDKLWSNDKDKDIYEKEAFIKNLYKTKNQLHQKWDIDAVKNEIIKEESELIQLKHEKELLMSNTAERFASRKINDLHIFNSFFYDTEFKNRLLNKEEFDELDDNEINKLFALYNIILNDFNEENIKKISLSSFFTNYFYLCDDNPQVFYGKPVINLTFFQVELFGFGRYYKKLLSDSKNPPPDDIINDPDKLAEWYNIEKNKAKYQDEDSEGSVHKTNKIREALMKKGGNLDHQDIINMGLF